MKVGDLVKNKLRGSGASIGIIIEIKDSIFVEDVHCNKWEYPDYARVLYSDGTIEYNPVALYEMISSK